MIQHFFFTFYPLFAFATFFHSGYVIKPSQPSSAFYGAPAFTGHLRTKAPTNCILVTSLGPK